MAVPERTESGRFLPGKSGNPKGRPRGSKNEVSRLKLELEQSLREDPIIQDKVRRIFNQALDLALSGNEKMTRLILEKFISSAASDDVPGDGVQEYVFRVVRADQELPVNSSEGVIDAEFTEVKGEES